MEFKKCSVQGVSFGEGITEAMMGAAIRDGRDLGGSADDQEEEIAVLKDKMVTSMTRAFDNRYFREDQLTLIAPDLPAHLADVNDPLRPHLIEFFRALAICHSVLSDVADPKKPFEVDYKAESPDEAALVAAARDVGFPFVNRNNTRIDIEVLGKPEARPKGRPDYAVRAEQGPHKQIHPHHVHPEKLVRAVPPRGEHILLGAGHPPAVLGLWRAEPSDWDAAAVGVPRHDGNQGWHRGLAKSQTRQRGEQLGCDQVGRMA